MNRIPRSSWPREYAHRTLFKITVSATPDMKFVPAEFEVVSGAAVELVFRNPDNLYHNLVILKPGTIDQVGLKADMMAARPDGLEKHYVPEDSNVLQWTPQITIGMARTHTLRFFAPAEPGDYPYICTFPGHWRVMRGVMRVSGR
jgi:azurin